MGSLLQLGNVDADAEQTNDGLIPVADQIGGDAKLVLVQPAPSVVGDEVGPVLVGPYGQLSGLVCDCVAQGASGELAMGPKESAMNSARGNTSSRLSTVKCMADPQHPNRAACNHRLVLREAKGIGWRDMVHHLHTSQSASSNPVY